MAFFVLKWSVLTVLADEVKSSKKFGIGAIIGVTVGGAVLMIFLMTLAYFFLFKRKSKAREGPKSRPDFFSIGKEGTCLDIGLCIWN